MTEDLHVIGFTVPGKSQPAGSKSGFINPKTRRVIITDQSGEAGRQWRTDVRHMARQAFGAAEPWEGPVCVELTFHRPRPKGHYRSGKNAHLLRDAAPDRPAVKPDIDKLVRAMLDALTGVAYADDSQVVTLRSAKVYAKQGLERVDVWVWRARPEPEEEDEMQLTIGEET